MPKAIATRCNWEPIYGNHCTNGTGPTAVCVHCGKPVGEWWEMVEDEPPQPESADA